MNKRKNNIPIWVYVIAAILLLRLVWVYTPSEAEVYFHVQETGITIEDHLSYEETVAVKKVLFGQIQWPEWLYGYPACGYGKIFAICMNGKYYMPSWDSCGMLAVMDASGEDNTCTYMNLSQRQIEILDEIISSRGSK